MPQSFVQNLQHFVFSTKHREPFLVDPAIRDELHRYLCGVCTNHQSPPIIVGGYVDHVHVVCRLSKLIDIAKMVQELKVESSKWMKTKGAKYARFRWQSGYGAFSLSPSHLRTLIPYVQTQETHHQGETFKVEFLRLLHKYEIEYDERYVWD